MFWSSTGILLIDKARKWSKSRNWSSGVLSDSACTSNFSRNCNKWSRFLTRHCNQDIAFWKSSRKVRRSLFRSCRRVIVVIPCWTCWSPAFDSCLQGIVSFCRCFWNISISSLCDVILSPCILQFSPLRSIYREFSSQQCCFGFPRSSPHLVAFPKMILLLVQVDLVNHFSKKL